MLFSTRQRVLTLALAGVFGTLLIAHLPEAHAQAASEQVVDIQLPAQSLGQSLTNLSRQTGVQVFAAGNIVAQRTAPAVSGRLTARQALDQLLSGTGLRSHATPGGDLVVQAPDERSGHDVLPPIKVRAAATVEDPLGRVDGFVASRSVTATKTDTPLLEVPQSISVIGRDELDARGAQSVMEALRYVPGVTVDSYGVETRGLEWALMRGFDSNSTSVLKDGLRMANSTWINFQSEAYGLERIEVLRGPASVTYGQVEAGGTIHRISKRPSADAVSEVEVQAGRYGRRQVAADLNGAFDSQGKLRYRLVSLLLDTDNQLKFSNGDRGGNEKSFVAPSLLWQITADTKLTVLAESSRTKTDGFSLYVVRDNIYPAVLRGDPDYLTYEQKQSSLGYEFEHRFNEHWVLRQNFRYAHADFDNRYINAAGFSGRTLLRSARHADDALRQTAIDTNVQGRFLTGGVAHTVLLGLDWTKAQSEYEERWAPPGTTPSLDLDNPVYGVGFPATSVLRIDRGQATRQLGLYVQDQMKIDQRWILTLGGREDVAKLHNDNHLNDTRDGQRDRAFSGRAGLTYLAGNGVAPYVSYAESFMPQNLKTVDDEPYKPTRGKQWELGVKVQPLDGRSLFTAAWFDLTKRNVETLDPDPIRASNFEYVQTGEIRSRGLELEAKTQLATGVNLFAAYTYNKVEVTRSNDVDLGKTPIQVPRQTASVGLDYALPFGLAFNTGIRYVGKRYDDAENTMSTKSFTLMDVGVRYDTGPWRVGATVSNLFDKTYVASRAYGGFYPGAERSLLLTAKYRF